MDVFALALWSLLTEFAIPAAAIFIAFLGVAASSAVAYLAYQTSRRATEIAKEGLAVALSESESARRATLDARLSILISAIPARMTELARHAEAVELYQEFLVDGGNPDIDSPTTPAPYEIHVLLESVRLNAKTDTDKRVLAAMAECFYAIVDLPPLPHRARLSHLPEMIRKWRDGTWSDKRALNEFTKSAQLARDRSGMTPPPPY